jgi:XTP/dITP diphosphohydrolase
VPATGDHLEQFLQVMLRLRSECAWKAAQTHRSLSRYLLEETYETLEAIDSGDSAHLREELGDLLLQVVFHSVIAAENGEFTLDDVTTDITEKMIRRNPHVFGDAPGGDAAAINEAWEAIKATEKQRNSVLEGLPAELPALLYAEKVLDRLARTEVAELGSGAVVASPTADIGERLLALVDEARLAGVDPEQALRDVVRRRTQSAQPPTHD